MAIYSGNKRLQAFTSVVQAGSQTPSGGIVDENLNMKFKDRSGNDLFSVNLSNFSFVQTIDIHPYMGMTIDGNGVLTSDSGDSGYLVLSGFSDVAPYMMSNIFRNSDNILSLRFEDLQTLHNLRSLYLVGFKNKSIKSVEFPNLLSVNGEETFYQGFYQSKVQNVDMSKLVSVNGPTSMRECFAECTDLTSVNLSSLESILGSYALYNAFYKCNIKGHVDLQNLTSINGYYCASGMFSTNPNISSVNLNNLQYIDGYYGAPYMFDGVTNLTELSLDNLSYIGSANGSISFAYAFRNTSLRKLNLPSLTAIYSSTMTYSFNGCKQLTDVDMHSLISIGSTGLESTFDSCIALSSVIMSNSINSIAYRGFYGTFSDCTSLREFRMGIEGNIPESELFYIMFRRCSNLSSVVFSGNFNISQHPNYSSRSGTFYSAFTNCPSLSRVQLSGLKKIINNYDTFLYAFDGCTSLTSLTFDELTTIEGSYTNRTFDMAFRSCGEIEVHFPKLLNLTQGSTNISCATFYNCTKLKKVYFDSLNSITGSGQNYLFNGCTILEEIHFKNDLDIQAYIEAHSGYTTKWGCPNTNCQIIFDL